MTMKIGWLVDGVVGGMSRLLHGVRGVEHDTSADLGPYLDREADDLFPAPTRTPQAHRRSSYPTFSRVVESVTFASEHVPLCARYRLRHDRDYAVNHTVHLRWMHPRRAPRKRILLYVHGWLEPGPIIEETTLLPVLSRELDVDAAHIQLPFHGRRNPRGSLFHGEYFWSADLVRSLEAVRQSVLDVRSAIRWFRAQGYEDIGVSGISLGGSITMLLACVEPTPDWIVPIIGHLDLGDAVENAPILWRMKADLERFGLDRAARAEVFRRIGIGSFAPRLPRERQLWVAAKDDMYVGARAVERQWKAWGEPPILWIPGGHMTFPVAVPSIVERLRVFQSTLPMAPRAPLRERPATPVG